MLSIGTLIGALVGGPVADWIGRRLSITFWCCVFCVGNIVMISSEYHWYQMMMGRFVAGLGIGGESLQFCLVQISSTNNGIALSLLVPMYMAETGPR